jgi:hypothetical protein
MSAMGYVREESDDEFEARRHPTLSCPECGSRADQDGYCNEPGCRNEGKTVAQAPPLFNDRRHGAPKPCGGFEPAKGDPGHCANCGEYDSDHSPADLGPYASSVAADSAWHKSFYG